MRLSHLVHCDGVGSSILGLHARAHISVMNGGKKLTVVEQLEQLVKRRDLRTADRANIQTMLRKVRTGLSLSYQEKQNLWAYVNRYLYHDGRMG